MQRYHGEGRNCNTFHGVLMATFGPDPNESGFAASLHPTCKTKGILVFSNACMTNRYDIVLVRFPSQ